MIFGTADFATAVTSPDVSLVGSPHASTSRRVRNHPPDYRCIRKLKALQHDSCHVGYSPAKSPREPWHSRSKREGGDTKARTSVYPRVDHKGVTLFVDLTYSFMSPERAMNSLIGSHPLDYGPDGAFRRNQAKSCDLFVNRSTIRQFHAEFMSRTRRAFRRLMLCMRSGLNPPPPSRAPPLFSAKRRLFSPVKRQSPIFLAHALLLCRCRRSCDTAIGRALGGGVAHSELHRGVEIRMFSVDQEWKAGSGRSRTSRRAKNEQRAPIPSGIFHYSWISTSQTPSSKVSSKPSRPWHTAKLLAAT